MTVMANAHTSVANVTRGIDSPSSFRHAAICSGAIRRHSFVVTGLNPCSQAGMSSSAIHRTVPSAVFVVFCRIPERPKSVSLALPSSSMRMSLYN